MFNKTNEPPVFHAEIERNHETQNVAFVYVSMYVCLCVFQTFQLACLPDTHSDRQSDRHSENSNLRWEMLLSWYRDIKEHVVFAPNRENSSTFDNYTTQSSTCVASTTLQYHPWRTMKCTVLSKIKDTWYRYMYHAERLQHRIKKLCGQAVLVVSALNVSIISDASTGHLAPFSGLDNSTKQQG